MIEDGTCPEVLRGLRQWSECAGDALIIRL
jgi:hypothetical protein